MSSSRIRDLPAWPSCPRCGERMVRTPSEVELAWMCPMGMYGNCPDVSEERFDADNLAIMDSTGDFNKESDA